MLALKVDIDTYRGMKEGVPRLIRVLSKHDIRATFFIAMGPENSGKAIWRFFTRRGFFTKMLRSNAVGMYGLRTALSGTLLPARQIARSFPKLFRSLLDGGHEVGIHGYDHVRWNDHLPAMSREETREEIEAACGTYRELAGREPESSSAPGWICTAAQLEIQDATAMLYHSDCRGDHPFFPAMAGKNFDHLQIPTTLPTLDEILAMGTLSKPGELREFFLSRIQPSALNVVTLHAEAEGIGWADWFDGLLGELAHGGTRFRRLRDIAVDLLKESGKIPRCEMKMGAVSGRSGPVAIQKTDSAGKQ